MDRGEKRIIGGVCGSFGDQYKISPLIVRLLFVGVTIFFVFPIFVYLLLWLIIPTSREQTTDGVRNKILWQTVGGLLGSIIGWYGGYELGMFSIGDDRSGYIVVILFVLIGVPTGALVGFSIGRMICERR